MPELFGIFQRVSRAGEKSRLVVLGTRTQEIACELLAGDECERGQFHRITGCGFLSKDPMAAIFSRRTAPPAPQPADSPRPRPCGPQSHTLRAQTPAGFSA